MTNVGPIRSIINNLMYSENKKSDKKDVLENKDNNRLSSKDNLVESKNISGSARFSVSNLFENNLSDEIRELSIEKGDKFASLIGEIKDNKSLSNFDKKELLNIVSNSLLVATTVGVYFDTAVDLKNKSMNPDNPKVNSYRIERRAGANKEIDNLIKDIDKKISINNNIPILRDLKNDLLEIKEKFLLWNE